MLLDIYKSMLIYKYMSMHVFLKYLVNFSELCNVQWNMQGNSKIGISVITGRNG